jgi:glutamyl-tRNA reductase
MTPIPAPGGAGGTGAATEWLTLQDACRLTGVTPATLRRWSNAGTVTTYTTPGGHRRFRRETLVDLVAARRDVEAAPTRQRPSVTLHERSATTRADDAASTLLCVSLHARHVRAEERSAYLEALRARAHHPGVVVLTTCQRVDVCVAASAVQELVLPEAPEGARWYADADAARHLIAVAVGLDSAVLGEDQVLHQLRVAHGERLEEGPLDPVLDRLLQVAERAGRRARAMTGHLHRSLADLALEEIGRSTGTTRLRTVVVIGAGRMGALVARAARARGAHVVVASRTPAAARVLADSVGGDTCAWSLQGESVDEWDGVVVALSGHWPVEGCVANDLIDVGLPVVDLSSPVSAPASLREGLAGRFHSIDDLTWDDEAHVPDGLLEDLHALVYDAGSDFCRWLRAREAAPTILELSDSVESRRRDEIAWLARRLPELGAEERAAVEQMSQRLVAAILHAPRKALGTDESGELRTAVRRIFEL